MNRSADPCHDFYQFACGSWGERHAAAAPSGASSWFSELQQLVDYRLTQLLEQLGDQSTTGVTGKLSQLFSTCSSHNTSQNTSSLHLLRRILQQNGGWPMLEPEWTQSAGSSWEQLAPMSVRGRGGISLVSVSVQVDGKNSSQYVLQLDQPSLPLPLQMLRDRERYSAILSAYRRLMVDIVSHIGSVGDQVISGPQSSLRQQSEQLLNFTIRLAEISSLPEQRRDPVSMYNKMSVAELQQMTDQVAPASINWHQLLEAVMSVISTEGGNWAEARPPPISQSTPVNVAQSDYIRKLSQLLGETEPAVIVNFIMWDMVSGSSDHLTPYIRSKFAEFYQLVMGSDTSASQDKMCVSWLSNSLYEVVDYLYLKQYFSETDKQKAEQVVSRIVDVFVRELGSVEWMDLATRREAAKKARAMKLVVGYAEASLNIAEIERKHKRVTPSSYHYNNYLNMNGFVFGRMLGQLADSVDRNSFRMPATQVNAMYLPELNAMNLPAAILQPPFFYPDIPVLTFGSAASVIGHELTHGFDDFGRHFDESGALRQWWTQSTASAFTSKAECLVRQYELYTFEFTDPPVTMHVNGRNTLGENIADNGGVGQALKAFFRDQHAPPRDQHWPLPGLEALTQQQLFFLSFAQMWCGSESAPFLRSQLMSNEHSPYSVRVTATLANLPQFAAAFHCSPNTPMNPSHSRCKVW